MSDFRTPPLSLLCKLGSIAAHVEEAVSDEGHPFDVAALRTLLGDAEVTEWMKMMDAAALLPVKRGGRKLVRQETTP